jgi:hypothetical protein
VHELQVRRTRVLRKFVGLKAKVREVLLVKGVSEQKARKCQQTRIAEHVTLELETKPRLKRFQCHLPEENKRKRREFRERERER